MNGGMKFYILLACIGAAFAASGIPDRCRLPAHPGFCKMPLLRWWFNAETSQCEEFYFGGCSGNANNFETKEACEKTCSADQDENNQRHRRAISDKKGRVNLFAGPVCHRPPYSGPCKAAFTRFYFDAGSSSCRTFIYGGCNSNGNNFRTASQCMQVCGGRMAPFPKPR
ncbi:thrombin inhibitor hemalin-like isoform X1 [Dermacentor andersoni]|uniref:thrombin inhibitor hemalin-like isoform X1 n=1 Tax=Dermacentor andersoni TaxID=34620 RepID=UPI0021552A01|nr:thrombin inhibitor hemalin-like isoform X1 [Dermacentor andersoni]